MSDYRINHAAEAKRLADEAVRHAERAQRLAFMVMVGNGIGLLATIVLVIWMLDA